MNLAQILTGVYNRLGVPSTDGQFTVDVVTDFSNDALREMSTEEDWPWLQATESLPTVASTSYVTPADAGWTGTTAITLASGTDVITLERRTRDELDDQYPTTTPGQPEVWAIYGDRIELRPIPDAVYTLTHRYVRADKVLTTSASPYLPDAYAPALCDLATVFCLGRSKEDGRAVAAQVRYDAWLKKMRDNRRRDRRPGRIRVRPGASI